MAWEKTDFEANYRVPLRFDDTRRLDQYRNPTLLGGLVDYDPIAGVTIFVHYHPNKWREWRYALAQEYVDWFAAEGDPLTGTDCIVIFGGAFNWTGEGLEDLVPGLEAVCVDLSNWVDTVKGQSPDDELIEAIIEAGYDHTLPNSVGEFVFNRCAESAPRSRNVDKITIADLSKNGDRNRVKRIFQRNEVTRIITEDVWSLLTAQEQVEMTAAAASYGAQLVHYSSDTGTLAWG
jgi:hypothetical protein